jgi:hypothetical protein
VENADNGIGISSIQMQNLETEENSGKDVLHALPAPSVQAQPEQWPQCIPRREHQ